MTELSLMNGGSPLIMTSGEIAELTGKDKNKVHRDIKEQLFTNLYGKDDPKLDHEQIQGLTIILDERGYWKEVQLDRYHTDILVSGYEVKYRAAIVKRWHELEAAQNKPLSPMEMVIWSAQQIIEQEKRLAVLSAKTEEQDIRISEIESRQSAIIDQSSYFSVLAYAINKNIKITSGQASGISRKCGSISSELGIAIGSIVDPRYGTVKTYHIDVLSDVFKTKGLLI